MRDTTEGRIDLDLADGLATIWIAHEARHNALTKAMWDQLSETCARIAKDPSVRITVLRGRGGRAFSTGADISEFLDLRHHPENHSGYNNAIEGGMASVASLEMPVVAAIQGICVGGGVALAGMCDLRLVNRSAYMGIPAGKLGVAYLPEWVRRLTLIMGPAAMNEILMTAGRFGSDRMYHWGFANELVDDHAFDVRLAELTATMIRLAPLTLKASKTAIQASLPPLSPEVETMVRAACTRCDESADYQTGINAFLAKRRPEFLGA